MRKIQLVDKFCIKKFVRWSIYLSAMFFALTLLTLIILKFAPLPPEDNRQASIIYDDQGNKIAQIGQKNQKKEIVLSEIPQALIDSTIIAEDRSFYNHWGFSIKGILRASWINLKAGKIVQGASTITQQLARNLYLSHDRTWFRKFKEALLTIQLEIHYDKDKILELYLNNIYYGNGGYGAAAASDIYFNKDIRKLSLAECSFLAGLPRGPSYYSPYNHLQRALKRQEIILNMLEQGNKITTEEAQKAKRYSITIAEPKSIEKDKTSYFRDYIIKHLATNYDLDEITLKTSGLKIYTTLNSKLQTSAENNLFKSLKGHSDLQGALVSVDPHTGQIKAMVGGKDYSKSQFNRVFAKRQPGSSFKPFIYLGALENDFSPANVIQSTPTTFNYEGEFYNPRNFGNNYPNKPIRMREAIAKSDNIFAVSTLLQIGINKEIDLLKQLGISSTLGATPSLALGSYAISPMELTEGYATIADGGIHKSLTSIRKIVDPHGNIAMKEKTTKFNLVASPANSSILTSMMTTVFDKGGTAHKVRQIFDKPAAGKTGTTDYDGWMSGWSSNLLTTVWVGYDKGRELSNSEAKLSQYVWAMYMRDASVINEPSKLKTDPTIELLTIDEETGCIATENCRNTFTEYFKRGAGPTILCQSHISNKTTKSNWNKFWNWLTE